MALQVCLKAVAHELSSGVPGGCNTSMDVALFLQEEPSGKMRGFLEYYSTVYHRGSMVRLAGDSSHPHRPTLSVHPHQSTLTLTSSSSVHPHPHPTLIHPHLISSVSLHAINLQMLTPASAQFSATSAHMKASLEAVTQPNCV